MKGLIPLLLLVFVMGCTTKNEMPSEQAVLRTYLEDKGYQSISYEGIAESYELTKQKIVTLPYMMYWGMQPEDPSKYFGKTITVKKFIVKNHPLSQGEVDVYVYVVDGQPIGGTSYPHGSKMYGGYWSIEGKTLEELQPKPFQVWRQDWVNRYSR
ncbi:hypothetical protein GON22_03245 [Paenibacillus sp. MMS18-CY102]|nr:hypothetical protein [Paenibacillus sp. MMS18-CY102]